MVSATTDTVLATTARGLLRLSPRPRLLPTPTCCTVDTATTDMVSAITDTVSATTDTVSATTARGLLRPSPRPRLIPTCCTADTVSDTGATEATTATARGLLRLSPRPRPTPTCCTADTDMDTVSDTDTDMVSDTAATTGDRLPTSFRATMDHHQLTDVQKYSKLYQK